MNKQVPKNVRKTAGVLMLTGVMAIGAFSLLKTGVLSTNVNKIATVAGTTEGGGTGGEGELPDGGETGGGTTKPETGTNKFGLIIENDTQVIDLADALPQTKAAALDNNTPHTFTIRNKGTVEQVVRLSMAGITKDLEKTELPADKVNILVRIKDGAEVTEAKTTLATIRTAGKAGYGNCFKLAGGAAKEFELFAWIDESASLEDLYGTDGKTSKQIKFQAGASAVQADAFTNQNEGTEMNKEFGQLVGAAQ